MPQPTQFTDTLESVCVGTVEIGFMTRYLASLIGRKQKFRNTKDSIATIDEDLQSAMAHAQAAE